MNTRTETLTERVVAMIRAERLRQVEREGWTPEHDDEHREGDLARAASCYAMPNAERGYTAHTLLGNPGVPVAWPWDNDDWKPTPSDRIRELVKAGALIVAEIERLKRAERPS